MKQRSMKGIAVVGVAALALLLAACGDAGTGDPPDPEPDPIVDPSDPDGPSHDLEDGETFAWVKGVTGDGLLIDPAEMLSGEEAREAAVADGFIQPGEDLPNDFYIRNPDDATSAVLPAQEAEYSLLMLDSGGSPQPSDVTYDKLAAVLNGDTSQVYGVVDGELPATVTIEDGMVVKIAQVYLP